MHRRWLTCCIHTWITDNASLVAWFNNCQGFVDSHSTPLASYLSLLLFSLSLKPCSPPTAQGLTTAKVSYVMYSVINNWQVDLIYWLPRERSMFSLHMSLWSCKLCKSWNTFVHSLKYHYWQGENFPKRIATIRMTTLYW